MPDLGIDAHLHLRQGDFRLDARLQLPGAGISVLLGRPGSGKTLLLRALAGLQRAEGFLRFRGRPWQEGNYYRPSHLRPLGYVCQACKLLPHLDVGANLAFGYRRTPRRQRRLELAEAIDLFDLADLLRRHPGQLSSAQRQRVALACALLTSPQLLLLDAPLSGVDQQTRTELLGLLEQLCARLQAPMLYATHAEDEIARLAAQLVVLDKGQTISSGPPSRLLSDPRLPLGRPDEAAVVLIGHVEHHDQHYRLSTIRVPGGSLKVALSHLPPGTETRIRIFARDVSISLAHPQGSSILNTLSARIVDLAHEPDSARTLVRLDLGGACILARITRLSVERLGLALGCQVHAQIKSVALMD